MWRISLKKKWNCEEDGIIIHSWREHIVLNHVNSLPVLNLNHLDFNNLLCLFNKEILMAIFDFFFLNSNRTKNIFKINDNL